MRYWETFLRLLIAGLIVLLLTGTVDRANEAVHAYLALRNADFDYQRLMEGPNSHRRERYQEGEGNLIRIFSEARAVIPAGSKIGWSLPDEGEYATIIARYALAPPHFVGRSNPDWDYFIDAGEEVGDGAVTLDRTRLDSGVWVYAQPGNSFLSRSSPEAQRFLAKGSLARKVGAYLGLTCLYLFLGGCLLLGLGFKVTEGRPWFLGASYLLGFLFANIVVQVFLMAGGRLTPLSLAGLWIPLALGLLWGSRRSLRKTQESEIVVGEEDSEVVIRLSFALAAGIVLCVAAIAAMTGVDAWDDRGHWILKSKAIYYYRVFRFDLPFHNEYPILWPLGAANAMVLMGGPFDECVKWTAALWIPVLASQLFGGLRLLGIRASHSFLLVFLFFACIYAVQLTTGHPHSALMCYTAGTLIAVLGWCRDPEDRRYPWLLLCMSWGLCNCKLEGSPMAIMIGMAVLLSAGRSTFSLSTWKIVGLCCLPVLSELAWILWQQAQGHLSGFTGHPTSGIGPTKLWNVFRTLAGTLEGRAEGYRLLAGMILALLLVGRRRWSRETVFLALAALAFFFFAPLAVSGFPSEDTLKRSITATPRLMLHATPAFLLFLGSLLKGIEGDDRSDSS